MAFPDVTVRVDWANKGNFNGPYDTVNPDGEVGIRMSRGASAELTAETIGELEFTLDDPNHAYSPDRNWVDNPSFESGVDGWSVAAIAGGINFAATSITQVTDNAPDAGTKAGELVIPANGFSGAYYLIPYVFKSGITYRAVVYLKSVSGSTAKRLELVSAENTGDFALTDVTITGSWAAYTWTWTPSGTRTGAYLIIQSNSASAATLRIDRVSVNPGSVASAWVDGPTKGQLSRGKPVHMYATYGGNDFPKFYGSIDRITPDPENQRVTIVAKDPFQFMADMNIVVPETPYAVHTDRTMRRSVLEDLERGNRNLLAHNPSFETNTTGWVHNGTSLTRVTTDAAPGGGTASADFVASTGGNRVYLNAYMAPILLSGETYRGSIYARTTSGTATWILGLGPIGGASTRLIELTTEWQRFSIIYTIPDDGITRKQSTGTYLPLFVEALGSGTVRIDNAAVTRGLPLYPYSHVGTGRWPNWVANGDFEGGFAASGWIGDWKNLISNPSFETNATGWSNAGSFYTTSSGAASRVVGDAAFGSAHGEFTASGGIDSGLHFSMAGLPTFKAGRTYDFGMYFKGSGGTAFVGLGAVAGTNAQGSVVPNTSFYQLASGTWTPNIDYPAVDVLFFVKWNQANTLKLDGAYVFEREGSVHAPYSDVGLAGGGYPIPVSIFVGVSKYGAIGLFGTSTALADTGFFYDFYQNGPVFIAGQQYTLSLWIKPTSSMPYEVAMGAPGGASGAADEASVTGTATANVWNQVTVTWTPAADQITDIPYRVGISIRQTDATARDIAIDGVRVIPGGTADDFESANLDIPSGNVDYQFAATAALSGSALAALGRLNAITLARHWNRAEMASPFYSYVTELASGFAGKTPAATIVEAIDGLTDLELSVPINVVRIAWDGGADVLSDEGSVNAYGPSEPFSIDGSGLYVARTPADITGEAFLSRYKWPLMHATMVLINDFDNQLSLDLNDMIELTLARFGIHERQFVILREDLLITQGGRRWETTYTLEEYPY